MKFNMKSFKRSASLFGLKVRKNAPTIAIVAGGAASVTAIVVACKRTMQLNDVVEEHKENLETLKEEYASPENTLTEREYNRQLTICYLKGGWAVTRLYLPAIALEGAALALIFSSHSIMRKRNASLAAAYATLDSIFNKYRNNIKEAFGEEVDRRARYGVKQEVVEEVEVDENGKEKVVKKTVEVVDDLGYSEYARFFDETCEAFSKDDPEYNKHFITCVNSWANTILETRGYLFLNEVYERLGLNKSLAGQTVGWIYDKERPGKVDFGVYSGKTLAARRFINGYEPVILLDFNVDGDIMANDKLKLYFANGF